MTPPASTTTLASLELGDRGTVARIGGPRSFRRRLMEMGLTPGSQVRLCNVAPLGDPLEIELRGSRLSIRRSEALEVELA